MRAKMRKFVSGLAKHVKKEGKAAILNSDMDFSRLVVIFSKWRRTRIKTGMSI